MKAYTAGGTRIGLIATKTFATIPRHWRVGEFRNANGWFRFIKDVEAEEKEQKDVHYEFIETAEGTLWKATAIFFCWESPHSHMRAFDMDHISDYTHDYIIADDWTEILRYGVASEDGEENFKEWSRCQPPRPTVEGSNWAEPPSEV